MLTAKVVVGNRGKSGMSKLRIYSGKRIRGYSCIALRAIFYFLLKNPSKLDKLRNEIDDACTAGLLSNPIKDKETRDVLPHMNAVIKEALRLHPSVAFTMPRVSPAEGVYVHGTFVPRGYRIGLNPYVIQRQQEIYVEDPDVFRP